MGDLLALGLGLLDLGLAPFLAWLATGSNTGDLAEALLMEAMVGLA